jgi:1-phosphatidylinositol phosphodiesterase
MSKLPDGTYIKDVVMPASHDAGMSELRHTDIISSCSMGSVKTQKNSIYEQMMCGVRYFDLRVDYDHSELVTYHRTKFMGANGQSFRMVFMQAQDFLREHDKEIIIFRISHFRNYNEHKPAETLKKLLDFLKKYSDTGLIYKSANPKKLHEINLGEARGKIILAVQIDDNSVPNAPNGIFKYSDAGDGKVNSIGENTLNVYDRYSNSSKYETMQKDQFEKWKNNGGQGDTKLFLLSWTLTLDTAEVIGGAFDSKYTNETLAKKANPKLAGMLAEGINTNKYAKPNMVYLDYIDSALCKEIISYNFK